MTDRIAELLEHYADALIPPGTHSGAAAPISGRRSRANRQLFGPVLLPAAAALVVVAVAAGAFLTRQHMRAEHITSTAAHTSSAPELGTLTVPATWGPPVGHGIQRGRPADLLAQTTNQMGTVVILAARGSNGLLCYVLGYLPPAATDSIAGVGACVPGSGGFLGTAAIEVSGVAPSGSPPLTFGQAPAGTRSIELSSPRRRINVPARNAGPTYDHHAYFIATWDLAAGSTTVRALDSRGRMLAALSYP